MFKRLLFRLGEFMVGTAMLIAVFAIGFHVLPEHIAARSNIENKTADPNLKIYTRSNPESLRPTPRPWIARQFPVQWNTWDVSELGWVGCSWFGGPQDKMEYGNTLALYPNTYAQDLNYLSAAYVAIRYPTRGYSRSQLRRAKVILEANGLYIEAKIVDWGPSRKLKHRGVDCSKFILDALGVVTTDLIKDTIIYPPR